MTPLRKRLIGICSVVISSRESALKLARGDNGVLGSDGRVRRIRRLLTEARNDIDTLLKQLDDEGNLQYDYDHKNPRD